MCRNFIICILLIAATAFAQVPGDFNCDGAVLGSDVQFLENYLFINWCGYLWQCTIDNGDYDADGIPLTVADLFSLYFLFSNTDPPDFPNNPESDTVIISSAGGSPGDMLSLPIYIKTIDNLTAVQIYVKADSNYITLDSVVFVDRPDLCNNPSRCEDEFHILTFPTEPPRHVAFSPGIYHYVDLFISINENIDREVTTWIEASADPEYALNTGFANLEFFTPVIIDGEISITPTGIADDEVNNLPISFSVNSYPNPFNASTTISYSLPEPSDVKLVIYDILGRKVKTLYDGNQTAGEHAIIWDADGFSSGIYFYELQAGNLVETRKMVLLK